MELPHAVYINLDRRTDRRAAIESTLDSLHVPLESRTRFAAVAHSNGWIGCTMSHCAVIELAKEKGWPAVLVLEDDFSLLVEPAEFHAQVGRLLEIPHDVALLAYHVEAHEEIPGVTHARRAFSAQAPSAYIVQAHFYDRLLENYRAAVTAALAGGPHWECINDQYWKRLQADRSTCWIYSVPRLGKQAAGHSDLANRQVDYGI
jgi:hypothetical protein